MCTGAHPYIPAAGVVTVQVIYDSWGQKIENVYNVISGAGTAVADLDRIQAKFVTWLTNSWRPISSSYAACALMVLNDASVENGVGKEYVIAPAIAGALTGQTVPNGTTVAIKWSTGFTGRSFRGRTFHIGLGNGQMLGNQITVAHQTALANAYNALRTTLAAGGTVDTLGVVSRCANNVWRADAVVTPITGASVDINIDSQRRRLTGRGK